MEVILNTFRFGNKVYGICFRVGVGFYMRCIDTPYMITPVYKSSDELLSYAEQRIHKIPILQYAHHTIQETMNSPVMLLVRALLSGG